MVDGIYILANTTVTRLAMGLMNSIRRHDPDVPVMLIPYDEQAGPVARILARSFGVRPFPDIEWLDEMHRRILSFFPSGLFLKSGKLRKFACWFGPFDRFLYLDCDLVVFDRVIGAVNYLDRADFLWCDYQYRLSSDFFAWPSAFEAGIYEPVHREKFFNTGFFASRKGLFDEAWLYQRMAELAQVHRHFPFNKGLTDQPMLNYLVLKHIPRHLNLVTVDGWRANAYPAGKFRVEPDFTLFDPEAGERHRYLHWSGYHVCPEAPYWDVWQHYYNLYRYAALTGAPLRYVAESVRHFGPLWDSMRLSLHYGLKKQGVSGMLQNSANLIY